MRLFEQYDETHKYFSEGKQKDDNAKEVQKHLHLHDLSVGEYLTDKYACCNLLTRVLTGALQSLDRSTVTIVNEFRKQMAVSPS